MKHIAIIGGWAAGMMAAASIIEQNVQGVRITLFEKNTSLGAKVIISGWGRCNVTTGYYRRKDLESKYIRGAERVREAIGQFGPRKIYQWFEDHGVPLKTEADMRVFPVSDDGKDIVRVFERLIKQSAIVFWTSVSSITHQSDGTFIVSAHDKQYPCDAVIIATGGQAYRQTGSTGDAYTWAQELGHTITPLGPSLNSFLTSDKRTHELSGLAFQNARITLSSLTGKKNISVSWSLLLTHFGVSGPLTFIVAAHSAFEQIDSWHPLIVHCSPDAEVDAQTWDRRLIQAGQETPRKQLDTILAQYLPHRFVDVFLKNCVSWQSSTPVGLLSKSVRQTIATLLWNWIPLTCIGRRPGDEFVTAGGVDIAEVDKHTMMSKILPWLFFAGEVLNVDGVTGGYNLTSSRATGRLAGLSALAYVL